MKRLKVFQVNSMTAQTVITKLSKLFILLGITRTITSDSVKCLNGIEFQSYCKKLFLSDLK